MAFNTRVVLSSRPDGLATADHFTVETEELDALAQGQVRIAVEYLSVDPALRTMLHGEGFHQHVGVGQVIATRGVGRIVESTAQGWAVGELVRGRIGAQSLATVDPEILERLDGNAEPSSLYLGTLGGSSGVTAWVGIRKIGAPAAGDTVVVSGAAGAVGSIAGQIAKIDGARVIGIAGGPEKVAYLTDVAGFDAAIDYKHEDVSERLRELAPDGIDVFFDNVGGSILDAALDNLAMRARVVICGAISQYDDMDQVTGPSLYLRLAERQSRMEGFAYFHFPECRDEAIADLGNWLKTGDIVNAEHVLDGIDQFPRSLEFMFSGGNIGKLVVKV